MQLTLLVSLSHRFQRVNAELHPYSSQYNPCRKVTVRLCPLSVWCYLLCNIWPIGKVIPWENHGCLPVVTSWHKLQIRLYIWSVGDYHEHQRNYEWALALLSSTFTPCMGVCEQGIDAWAYCSQTGLAPRHGQCQASPRAGVPPLRSWSIRGGAS